jgi:phage shock protein A
MAIHDQIARLTQTMADLEHELDELRKEVVDLKKAIDSFTAARGAAAPKKASAS